MTSLLYQEQASGGGGKEVSKEPASILLLIRRGERGSFILESSDGEGQRGKRRSPRETKFKAPCWRHVPPGRASGGKVSPLGAGREIKNIVYIFYLESRNY